MTAASASGARGPAGLPALTAIRCLRRQYSQQEQPAWEEAESFLRFFWNHS